MEATVDAAARRHPHPSSLPLGGLDLLANPRPTDGSDGNGGGDAVPGDGSAADSASAPAPAAATPAPTASAPTSAPAPVIRTGVPPRPGLSPAAAAAAAGAAAAAAAALAASNPDGSPAADGSSKRRSVSRRHFFPALDALLLTEMVAVDGHMAPYGAKGKRFSAVAAALNAHPDVPFEVTPKAATDRYELLMEWYRKGDVGRLRRNGSEEDYDTVAELLAAVAADLDNASAAKAEAAAVSAAHGGPGGGGGSGGGGGGSGGGGPGGVWANGGSSGAGSGARALLRGSGRLGPDEEEEDGIVVTPLLSGRLKRARLEGGVAGPGGGSAAGGVGGVSGLVDDAGVSGPIPALTPVGDVGGGGSSTAPSPWDVLLRIERERNALERQRLEGEAQRLEVEAARLRAQSVADAARLAAEKDDRAATRTQMAQLMSLVADLAKGGRRND
ncbi:hypothetical protein MMPV_003172 [Pyropia vietnamensis]